MPRRLLVLAAVGVALLAGGLALLEPATVLGSRLDGERLLGVGLAVVGLVLLAACLGRLHRPGRPWWPLLALGAAVLVVGVYLAGPTTLESSSEPSTMRGIEMSVAYGDESVTTWLTDSQVLGAATAALGLCLLAALAGARRR